MTLPAAGLLRVSLNGHSTESAHKQSKGSIEGCEFCTTALRVVMQNALQQGHMVPLGLLGTGLAGQCRRPLAARHIWLLAPAGGTMHSYVYSTSCSIATGITVHA